MYDKEKYMFMDCFLLKAQQQINPFPLIEQLTQNVNNVKFSI